ncbi:hypothetical protein FA10DRAFT_268851 [Acaromyces ingoldii]|uniref:Elongator complex protein 4 n=1 Tax=Acaromyces ingoldii TaxID=215250 RepID=A0A316YHZ0_9BASI|nr:hypothetical protein FA10DRAFT_268851 [Acaromyces ingoldii]PWN88686.1 hypothetical protein FA10DRAFT_268851 [Acaromyces ingoldii]
MPSSSFKRRTPTAQSSSVGSSGASPAAREMKPPDATVGLKPAPYPSLVAHYSTGLASLDDVLTGSGLPSSSVLLLCPALGLANPLKELAAGGAEDLEAAEREVVQELAGYGIAQGLVSGHRNLVVAPRSLGPRAFVQQLLPAMATSSSSTKTTTMTTEAGMGSGEVEAEEEEEEEEMKIAFRYAHRPKFKTTVKEPQPRPMQADKAKEMPAPYLFNAPFDRSKRWTREALDLARAEGSLVEVEANGRYDEVLRCISTELSQKRASRVPVRIHLLSIGAEGWCDGHATHEQRLSEASRFLLRLRSLVKTLALGEEGVPCVATATIAASLLCSSSSSMSLHSSSSSSSSSSTSTSTSTSTSSRRTRAAQRTTLHLARFADALLCLSSFSHSPHLARAFPSYGGALHLVKGPCVGAVLPPGESRSVLRGGLGEAGAENDVGWRQKKRGRGVVIETLHEDVDPEDPAEAAKKRIADASNKDKTNRAATAVAKDDIEEAARGLQRRPAAAAAAAAAEMKESRQTEEPNKDEKRKPAMGLSGLRARGLEARQRKQITVEIEGPGAGEDATSKRSKAESQADW